MKLRLVSAAVGSLLLATGAPAQVAYPERPITLVMPYAVGGGADLMARVLADAMRKTLAQPITVSNITGAGSILGSRQVANAPADGYTLLMNHIGLSTAPALFKSLQLDPVTSFEHIGLIASIPMLVVGGKHLPASNAKELIAHVRRNGDKVTMASSGMGSGTHLCAMLFEKAVGAPWEGHHDYSSVEDFGYCGGATMLVQFDRLVRSGRLSPGTLVAAYLEESSKWMSGGFLARA